MKLTAILALGLLLPVSFFINDLLSKQDYQRSKTLFDYELELKCSSKQWDKFTECPKDQLLSNAKKELVIPVVDSGNNSGRYELVLSHQFYYTKVETSLRLGDGKFMLTDADDHYICGTYEGYIDQTDDRDDLLLFLNIKGGSGRYEGLNGHLSATCIPDPDNPSHRNLYLKGITKQSVQLKDNVVACLKS